MLLAFLVLLVNLMFLVLLVILVLLVFLGLLVILVLLVISRWGKSGTGTRIFRVNGGQGQDREV